jgi:hypothetical protein
MPRLQPQMVGPMPRQVLQSPMLTRKWRFSGKGFPRA